MHTIPNAWCESELSRSNGLRPLPKYLPAHDYHELQQIHFESADARLAQVIEKVVINITSREQVGKAKY